MKRRQFIRQAGTASVAGVVAAKAAGAKEKTAKPNVMIVHCDEMNFRCLGCYRDTLSEEQALMWGPKAVVETPHIDQLAKEGALITKMYAATPVCSPSRSSFISGKYPQNTPVVNNNVPLADEVVSFAALMAKDGYATGYAGKWHLDGEAKPGWAPKRNFGFEDNRYMFNRGHWKQFEDTPDGPRVKARKGNKPDYSVKGADEESFATDWLTDKAIEFAREHADEPWCYMLSLPDPHGPDTVRAPYNTMFTDDSVEKPRTYDKNPKTAPSWARPAAKCGFKMAQYHGMMKCIDDNMGKLIVALKDLGVYDNTILIFTADHGDMRGEHHRQNKGIPLEASAKIPFVIRWPETIRAGAVLPAAVNTADFLPTICALTGTPTADLEEGVDFSGLLTGVEVEEGLGEVTFMRSTGKPGQDFGWLSAVDERYKLVLSSSDDAWLLDLEDDPDELRNFIETEDGKAAARRLARALDTYAKRTGDNYARNPKIKAQLAELTA